ncbi:enoyl-CoA hydratase/isomerase family protein [Solimonas terrae]|uniref:Enoyl-CoA hydratase/isomerase family protein n=1 Tax=Solimonas terrae TaxID=1396819 RepID=A0A6M2BQ17_9GAMM|nr:enoyl-CoA hydratase/isomerase family protein [Solimonas terrae]NGY04311.1 enoyl-CoA hydratase/isomerase family protein [Solimonas terrae]
MSTIDETLLISAPAAGVRLITFNRPAARNALTLQMQEALDTALTAFEDDRDVRALVLAGAGDRAFSAGYDIHEMQHFDEATLDAAQQRREVWLWHLASYAKPIVAAVNGAAHGAGAIIATAADIRIGCGASDFRYTAGAYGYANNTWQLAPIVGLAKAKEYLLTAARIDAGEALQSGLLNQLVDAASVRERAIDTAAMIAANPPDGVQATKRLLHAAIGDSYEAAYRRENALMHGALRPGKPADMFKGFLGKQSKS